MSQLLTPASLDELSKERQAVKKSSEFSKTQKNYSSFLGYNSSQAPTSRVSSVLKSMQEMDDDDASTYLGNFNPPPAPNSAGVQRTIDQEGVRSMTSSGSSNQKEKKAEPFSMSATSNVPQNQSQSSTPSYELNNLRYAYQSPKQVDSYYQQMVPNYKPGTLPNMFSSSSSSGTGEMLRKEGIATIHDHVADDGVLLQKLNYMIHLLEEKQDVKTNSTIEEIIMYCFLGIFIIFIVDSFSRVGKYVR